LEDKEMSERLPLDQFVERQLASGKYPSYDALVENALRLLQEHEAAEDSETGETNGSEREAAAPEPIWEKIRETFSNLSEEDLASLPVDGAAQVDHYAYGLPKR
jgi:Arc/MetJ-type ribon-helix-helix transcriptional regulator